MNFRVLILSGIINLDLVIHLIIPMIAISSVYIVIILYVFIRNKEKIIEASSKDISFSNPFEITSALQFGIIYGLIMFITKLLQHFYGEKEYIWRASYREL